jgi:formate-dependent nitrite reductase membrane component NrfD
MMESFERRWESGRRGGRGEKRGRTAADEAKSSYYGVPPIHMPHWKWLIIVYFFLGGISSASYVIASLAHLFGPASDRRIVRIGRYLSLATLIPSPLLLILDLGRPERFHHMLRVVKLRSPMSLGTRGLTIFGCFSVLSAIIQGASDGLLGRGRLGRLVASAPARAVGAAGTPPAFLVGGYTGVLLAATAVPLWAKNAMLMGPLFLSSAFSSATSAISLVLALDKRTDRRTLERLERLEQVVLVSELSIIAASSVRLGATAKPMVEGRNGAIFRYGTIGVGILGPVLVQLARALGLVRRSRTLTGVADICALVGGFLMRYTVVMGGHHSAEDPQATFDFTRAPDIGKRS